MQKIPRWFKAFLACVAILVALFFIVRTGFMWRNTPPPDVACTADAKQCPDDSYVGRVAPSCEFAACPQGSTTSSAGTPTRVEAMLGKTIKVGALQITPTRLLEDSRCPVNVECVWAGRVRVDVRIMSGMGASTMTLTTGTPVTTEAEKITLVDVLPIARAGVKLAPAEYTFVFEVEKR